MSGRAVGRGRAVRWSVTVHFVAAYSAVLWPHQVGPDEGEGEGRGSGGTGKEEKRCKFFLCKTATPCRVTSSAVDSVGFQRSREEIHFYRDSISCI